MDTSKQGAQRVLTEVKKQSTSCIFTLLKTQQMVYEVQYIENREHEPMHMGPYRKESGARSAITWIHQHYDVVMELPPEEFFDEVTFRQRYPRWWEEKPPIDVKKEPIRAIKRIGSHFHGHLVACLLLPDESHPRERVGYDDLEFLALFDMAYDVSPTIFDAEVQRRQGVQNKTRDC